MSTKSAQETLFGLICPVVEAMGFELWGVEYLTRQQHHATLRIYIEKDSKEGIGLHDCEKVSRQLSSVLDVEDPIAPCYTLEVSSPGMDRPLFTPVHYRRFVGAQVVVRLQRKFEDRRKFTGIIVAFENDELILRAGSEEYLLPVELIEKVNVVPVF